MLFFFCLRYSHITFTITHLCLFFIGFYFIFIFFLISLSVSFFWLGFALLCARWRAACSSGKGKAKA